MHQLRTWIVRISALMGLLLVGAVQPAAAQSGACSGDHYVSRSFANGANWDLCWERRSREGIILHDVYYTNPAGQRRRVLAEAWVAQIHVPYDDNGARYHDVSDYGLGTDSYLNTLRVADCPRGRLRSVDGRTAVCTTLVTRPGNALIGRTDSQYLQFFNVSHVGSYNYIPEWRFHDDGAIEPLIGATGRLQRYSNDARYGWKVNQNELQPYGISHMHNYYWRLDFDLGFSGTDDNFEELDVNYSLANGARTLARRQIRSEAGLDINPDSFRSWRVSDTASQASNGQNPGYEIILRETGHRETGPDTEPWSDHDVYVTRARACERFSSRNPVDTQGGCGTRGNVAQFVNGESIVGEDFVVWVSLSFHHLPRDEDETYMHAHWSSFEIVPQDISDLAVSGSSGGSTGSSSSSSSGSSGSSSSSGSSGSTGSGGSSSSGGGSGGSTGGSSSSSSGSSGGTADACPNGIFDDGNMYTSENVYTANVCNLEGQTCYPIYFYGLSSYQTAQCSAGEWIVAGSGSASSSGSTSSSSGSSGPGGATSGGGSSGGTGGGTGGGSSGGSSGAELCPNAVFDDGFMYDGEIQYTENRCTENGQNCPSVYFYALGRYTPARCSGNVWESFGG